MVSLSKSESKTQTHNKIGNFNIDFDFLIVAPLIVVVVVAAGERGVFDAPLLAALLRQREIQAWKLKTVFFLNSRLRWKNMDEKSGQQVPFKQELVP